MLTTPPAAPPVCGRSRGRRAVSLTVTAVAAAGLLTSCASTSTRQAATSPAGGAAATSAGATSPGRTVTPGRTMAASPVDTGSPGNPDLTVCQPTSLQVSIDASQAGGAAGSMYYPVNFTNTSSAPCALYGYPGMSFVTARDSGGRQIGAAAQQNPGFGKVEVRLAAGGMAHAWLQVTQAGSYPASACQPVTAHWLRVFAPGETKALYLNHAFDACSSASAPLLTVMPVRPGQGVQGSTP